MSLFDSISSQMVNAGISAARQAANSAAGSIAREVNSSVGGAVRSGRSAINDALGSTVGGIANSAINAGINAGLGQAGRAINDAMGGAMGGFGLGGQNLRIGATGGSVSQPCGAVPILGGVSMAEAAALHQQQQEADYAKKNLWMLEVVSSPLFGSFQEHFNLYAFNVEYAPVTISGDKIKVGAAVIDSVLTAEPVEMRVTTRDDRFGSIRKWFDAHANASVNADGTVGYPADYLIKIKVTHAFITPDSNQGGHEDFGQYRAGSVDVSLSRSEDALEEMTMTFIQLDTFMRP